LLYKFHQRLVGVQVFAWFAVVFEGLDVIFAREVVQDQVFVG
jgi:hypothetical protein